MGPLPTCPEKISYMYNIFLKFDFSTRSSWFCCSTGMVDWSTVWFSTGMMGWSKLLFPLEHCFYSILLLTPWYHRVHFSLRWSFVPWIQAGFRAGRHTPPMDVHTSTEVFNLKNNIISLKFEPIRPRDDDTPLFTVWSTNLHRPVFPIHQSTWATIYELTVDIAQ